MTEYNHHVLSLIMAKPVTRTSRTSPPHYPAPHPRVLYAPDSYGGFLGAVDACRRVEPILREAGLAPRCHPLSDGGEGLLEVLDWHHRKGSARTGTVPANPSALPRYLELDSEDAMGRPTRARALLLKEHVVLESARVIGLNMPGQIPAAMEASSHGLGLVLRALARELPGAKVVLGLGGTVTMDAGAGALQALGILPWVPGQGPIQQPVQARHISQITRLKGCPPQLPLDVSILSDVRTPLLGAPDTFGPQKGLDRAQIPRLRAAFGAWARLLGRWCVANGKEPLPVNAPGGGAAGGLGWALASAGVGRLIPGSAFVASITGLEQSLRGAGALLLGEGRMDPPSFQGKVAGQALATARSASVPLVAALVGQARDLPPAPRGPDLVVQVRNRRSFSAFDEAARTMALAIARRLGQSCGDTMEPPVE